MNQELFFSGAPPPFIGWQPVHSPPASTFWQSEDLLEHIMKLKEKIGLLHAVKKELEQIHLIKRKEQQDAGGDSSSFNQQSEREPQTPLNDFLVIEDTKALEDDVDKRIQEIIKANGIGIDVQELLSIEAANALCSAIKSDLAPITSVTNQASPWLENSMAVKLAQKLKKNKRNKQWRKRKRKHIGQLLRKERENYDKADKDADEWRAREIARDIARRKVESMKKIAKLQAKEEKKKFESELEIILMVEKLQELRAIRVQKLKRQGHFLPEEDDKFLERVRAAVEEEERQAAAAADTCAAKDAIATAEESRKFIHNMSGDDTNQIEGGVVTQVIETATDAGSGMNPKLITPKQKVEAQGTVGDHDSLVNLPFEFYHYYYGSSYDMGTLIEVRRTWDAYIRPGGSRIPGHWVQPPPPADEVWASYLVQTK